MSHNDNRANGVGGWLKREVSAFFHDPLDYAIDRWIYLAFLGFGAALLIGAFSGLIETLKSALSH
jgi:hypothetical protein